FGPGILLDPVTMRPVTGRVLQVLEVDSDLPLATTPAVVSTNSRGYYGQFTVVDEFAVLIRGGNVDEVVAAVDRAPQSGTSGTVPIFPSQAEALAFEAANPGQVALWFAAPTSVTAT